MADAGCSSEHLRKQIKSQYHSIPIIDLNPTHKKAVSAAKTTLGFAVLRKQRQAVERAYSRLKGQRSLNSITTRGWRKITVHCYLSLIAMQVSL
jgi:RsiW-degrading membrane proteinase PrsW (M82 family)